MNLLKKCASNDRLYASRNQGRHSSNEVGQAGRADSSGIKADTTRAGGRNFAEDFTREHSLPSLHTASIEISGSF